MGEGVGQGVGVGVRAILVFFGAWQREGFFVFRFFWEGGSVAGQVFVFVCVRKEAAPLMGEVFGGDGERQVCTVPLPCYLYVSDACMGCGCRRGQDADGASSVREAWRW